jgi:putative glutamine amidotransferase
MAPLIGLTTYREPARWGVWEQSADLLPSTYATAVESVGGVPVLLPPTAPYAESAAVVVSRLDGLVVSGGADVDPAQYGQEPHPRTGLPRRDRDAWELALLEAAAGRELPTLGVCRGMQVMAVGAGGSLEQHLPDSLGATTHDPGGDAFGEVEVTIASGSRLAEALARAPRLHVRCHHHQAVREHPGYEAVAWASDGELEAMEGTGARFLVGVQWHPEVVADAGLFRALVQAAAS